MRLIYGTGNAAKLWTMEQITEGLGIEIIGLSAFTNLPTVDETGNDPLENATLKATAYYRALGQPLFSCDSGLYIEGLPEAEQPGVHVRHIGGQHLSDAEMLEHYAAIAQRLGGQCVAQYRNAICLILDETRIFRYDGSDLSGDRFLISSQRHPQERPGYPIDSLSVDIASGRYYFDIAEGHSSITTSMQEGFRNFFRRTVLQENASNE